METPWDPTIWDGRKKWSQQWCRRKGMVPDNIKGMKGNDGGKNIKGKGNDGGKKIKGKGTVPDDIKGMKGNDGGNDIKGNGNDKPAVDEPKILKDLAAKEKAKGKRKGKGNGNGRAKWRKLERAAVACDEKAEAFVLAWLHLEQRRLAFEPA